MARASRKRPCASATSGTPQACNWWFTTAAELTVFVQVILGVAMVAGQGLKAPKFHMFYGFVAIIAVALIYSYRQQMAKHKYLLYGFGGLFLAGLGIRAMLKATGAA